MRLTRSGTAGTEPASGGAAEDARVDADAHRDDAFRSWSTGQLRAWWWLPNRHPGQIQPQDRYRGDR